MTKKSKRFMRSMSVPLSERLLRNGALGRVISSDNKKAANHGNGLRFPNIDMFSRQSKHITDWSELVGESHATK
ncbi:hypothetical protein LROSL1_1169 [Furfurilactobacillus rossiae]|nr:hypothetical protein LROSL1_1169 [Furfurilactobacillus rossiae]